MKYKQFMESLVSKDRSCQTVKTRSRHGELTRVADI